MNSSALNGQARRQLSALAGVHELLGAARIEYWLFGGWAVDFHAGAVTRPHDDIDIAVWLVDLPRIAELLAADGWEHAPEDGEDGGTGYLHDGVRLELTYLVRGDDGKVVTPLRNGVAPWSEGALANDVAELQGVRSRVVGLVALARGKARSRGDPEEAKKDHADARMLERLGRRDSEAASPSPRGSSDACG